MGETDLDRNQSTTKMQSFKLWLVILSAALMNAIFVDGSALRVKTMNAARMMNVAESEDLGEEMKEEKEEEDEEEDDEEDEDDDDDDKDEDDDKEEEEKDKK